MADIEYSDNGFEADAFVTLAKRVWPREYRFGSSGGSVGSHDEYRRAVRYGHAEYRPRTTGHRLDAD